MPRTWSFWAEQCGYGHIQKMKRSASPAGSLSFQMKLWTGYHASMPALNGCRHALTHEKGEVPDEVKGKGDLSRVLQVDAG